MTTPFLQHFYDDFERVEQEFQQFLDESLRPRGSNLLFDVVAELGLSADAIALDLGCGGGELCLELTTRFGFSVLGVDPVPRHIEEANEALARQPNLKPRVRFQIGAAESIPAGNSSVDLIWCREALYHFDPLDAALAECQRVLRPGARMVIYNHFTTNRMEPSEAEWWHKATPGTVIENLSTAYAEMAFTSTGFEIEQSLDLSSEVGEYFEEQDGRVARRLIHIARLQRDPERYVARYGQANYDIMLGDCLWHVYRLLGKLKSRIYLLQTP